MDWRVLGTSSSKVSNLSGNGGSSSQYGSLIVSCDIVGSSSLILVGGGRLAGVPISFDELGLWHPLEDEEIW